MPSHTCNPSSGGGGSSIEHVNLRVVRTHKLMPRPLAARWNEEANRSVV